MSDKVARLLGREDGFVSSTLQLVIDALRPDARGLLGAESVLATLLLLTDKTCQLKTFVRKMGPLARFLPLAGHVDVLVFVLVALLKVVLVAGRDPEDGITAADLLLRAKHVFAPARLATTVAELLAGMDVLAVESGAARAPLRDFDAAAYYHVLRAQFQGLGVPIADAKL